MGRPLFYVSCAVTPDATILTQPRPRRDHPDTRQTPSSMNDNIVCPVPHSWNLSSNAFAAPRRSHIGNIVCSSVSHRRRSRSQNRTDTSFHRPLPNPKNRCGFLSKRRSAGEPTSPNLSNALTPIALHSNCSAQLSLLGCCALRSLHPRFHPAVASKQALARALYW